ncbi:MAG TPA: adenosine deaminase family protein [Candidatus Aminicenantes bacterium]|nr:adenosine deaminase family protein [Candidatus Aminicenantes bacterium]
MKISREFIERIPKTDLHLHLDGSMRLKTLLELAQKAGVELPGRTEAELKRTVFKDKYADLGEYLKGFGYLTAVMQTPDALERVARELAEDNQAEGVRYIEVRFAPQLHQHPGMGIMDVFQAVYRGLESAKQAFNQRPEVRNGKEPAFDYGIIACAMRMFDTGFSNYFDRLLDVHCNSERKWIFSLASQELVRAAIHARDVLAIPVAGFDLAGQEKGYPAVDHAPAYALAHRHFLKKTVHAGEAFGPESIFQAITELHADRLGHALHLFDEDYIGDPAIQDRSRYVDNLVQYIGDRRITIEVCLTSNLQTNPDLNRLSDHSFGRMMKNQLSVTICTDNRTVSATTVSNEMMRAVEAFDLKAKDLKDLVIHGFKRSFFPGTYVQKRRYVRRMIDFYETVERRF